MDFETKSKNFIIYYINGGLGSFTIETIIDIRKRLIEKGHDNA